MGAPGPVKGIRLSMEEGPRESVVYGPRMSSLRHCIDCCVKLGLVEETLCKIIL